jgi:hypothetical protein
MTEAPAAGRREAAEAARKLRRVNAFFMWRMRKCRTVPSSPRNVALSRERFLCWASETHETLHRALSCIAGLLSSGAQVSSVSSSLDTSVNE